MIQITIARLGMVQMRLLGLTRRRLVRPKFGTDGHFAARNTDLNGADEPHNPQDLLFSSAEIGST